MPITPENAIDELYGIIKDFFDNDSAAIVGYIPEVRWPGVLNPAKPDPLKFWARVSTKTVLDNQSTLTDGNGAGTKRYTNVSLLFIQIFAPRALPLIVNQGANPEVIGQALAYALRDAFRHPSPSQALWFRDQKVDELAPTSEHYPFNVVVTFQYDTISPSQSVANVLAPRFPAELEGLTRHYPVEALDSIRTTFTFIDLPMEGKYVLIFNGIIEGIYTRLLDQITLGVAPNPLTDSLYALW